MPANQRLMQVSQQLFSLIDLVSSRPTAFGFAVVGNFEEAINAWRRDASLWKYPNEGVFLASAVGAVGVQLGAYRAGRHAGPFARLRCRAHRGWLGRGLHRW